MAGLTELSGSLIQMNSHLNMSGVAIGLIALGVCISVVSIITIIVFLPDRKSWRNLIIGMAILLMVSIGTTFWGYSMPREKIITACVNGPISIERISAVYDIQKIDGKMLILKER